MPDDDSSVASTACPAGGGAVSPARARFGQRLSLGTYATKAEAELAYSTAVVDQRRGAWVTPEEGRLTLAVYAEEWLATRLTSRGEPLRPRTRDLYGGLLQPATSSRRWARCLSDS